MSYLNLREVSFLVLSFCLVVCFQNCSSGFQSLENSSPIHLSSEENTESDEHNASSNAPTSSGSESESQNPSQTENFLFRDGFESGNLSHSENGFFWGRSQLGGTGALIDVNDAKPKSGSQSLLMRFAGSGYANSWTEQRMVFTSNQQKDLWLKFDLFVPTNFSAVERLNSVTKKPGGDNNKFIAFYNGDYSSNFQVNFSYHVPLKSLYPDSIADLSVHIKQNGSDISSDPFGSTHAAALFTTSDLGKWVQIVARVKVPSAHGVADGVMELWKNGKKIYSYSNLPIWGVEGFNYMDGLYILGWANTGFAQSTDFYLDNVELAQSDQWTLGK